MLRHNKCCTNMAKQLQHHAHLTMLAEEFDHFQTCANNMQHVATYCNTMAKHVQHVVPDNVACDRPGLKTCWCSPHSSQMQKSNTTSSFCCLELCKNLKKTWETVRMCELGTCPTFDRCVDAVNYSTQTSCPGLQIIFLPRKDICPTRATFWSDKRKIWSDITQRYIWNSSV